ncbi:MAG: CinA family nicotinamide mononucleotide deamidase-related protein [Gemmatimonadales bacterium]
MPDIELLTIGTELLLGLTLDTNSAELGRALAGAGFGVVRRTSVTDHPAAIGEAARAALGRTGLVVCTGGLGPTADDITKRVIADLFDMPLEFQPALWQGLVDRFSRFGRVPSEKNRSQAEVPRGATVLPNRWGTAPGLWLEGSVDGLTGDPQVAILLPGVPSEMRGLLHHEVLPRLARRAGDHVVRSRTVRTTGIPESSLAGRLGEIEAELAPLSLAYLPGVAGVDLRLTAWSLPAAEADARLAVGIRLLAERAGRWAYGEEDADLAELVLAAARRKGWRLVVAESCTGGGVGARLTNIAGSSDVFLGGIIAYDNQVKVEQLGVAPELIERHGAVSEAVARAMAVGVARLLRAEAAVAVTGIAGPGGGSTEKPVGLVCIGIAVAGSGEAHSHVFPGDRGEIRGRAAQTALSYLLQRLTPTPAELGALK